MRRLMGAIAACLALTSSTCADERPTSTTVPDYATDVAPILVRSCSNCHAGAAAAAGWRATSFLETIACVPSGEAATVTADAGAPIVRVLQSDSHVGLLRAAERSTVLAWVAGGAPAFRGVVHPPGIVDPRSEQRHGRLLRERHWAPMLDGNDPDACGRCHEGTPARPPGITSSVLGATACTSCHTEPRGALACGTCHGDGARPYPPRDACFFHADGAARGAHAAHVESTATHAGLACATCHPVPGADVIGGAHGNGSVEVIFDPTVVTPEASYDRTSGACAVSCHDRGGARARPPWKNNEPMGCGDCHGSPPAAHFPGACTTCHREANAKGTELARGAFHMNGKIDLGDGSGTCGACHGKNHDAWPGTGAHHAHEAPNLAAPIECATCHLVPSSLLDPGHLNGVVEVAFSGRATSRGAEAAWDGKNCTSVACHGAKLVDSPPVVPAWRDRSGAASACGACHGIPPTQHTASTSCDRVECHGAEITRTFTSLGISASGKALHVDGAIDPVR